MIKKLPVTVLLVCFAILANGSRADAQIAPSGKQAAGIFAVLIGAVVGVGVGVYFLVRSPHNVTGCVSTDGGNLQLTEDKSTNRYLLGGDSSALQAGERVRVNGKPGKDSQKRRTFFVHKVSRKLGSCTVAAP